MKINLKPRKSVLLIDLSLSPKTYAAAPDLLEPYSAGGSVAYKGLSDFQDLAKKRVTIGNFANF